MQQQQQNRISSTGTALGFLTKQGIDPNGKAIMETNQHPKPEP
jgi:hypothetical protein